MIQRLNIGEWWVDRTTNELGGASGTVRVEPKAMEVLMALADRAGQVVSRDELLAAVWPGVVVGDEALTQSIIKLRKALGDNPRSPSYIETISKRGYRLIAPVGKEHAVLAPAPRRRLWPMLVAGLALAALAAGIVFYQAPPAEPVPEAFDAGGSAPLTVMVLPFETLGPAPSRATWRAASAST